MPPTPRPLDGIRVVSLAPNLPGPLAATRLVSMGATVTKVEPPSGDLLATAAPSWYAELAKVVEVVTLDLKDAAGRAALEERLATADVLITSMRPSAFTRLGLHESVDRHGLVLVEIVGHDGDRQDEAGHDLTYQAAFGTVRAPQPPLVLVADLLGGERAVSAALAGLRQRDLHGGPVRERVVLEDAARAAGAGVRHGVTSPGGVLGGGLATYNLYATADGHVAVAALEPHFAERLGQAVGRTAAELTERFAAEPSAHWEDLARSLDLPIVAVLDVAVPDVADAARHVPDAADTARHPRR